MLLYELMARALPYAGQDSCELVVGVNSGLLPRPALDERTIAAWPREMSTLMG